jgi:GNAT superfamily N-acetyltransferase
MSKGSGGGGRSGASKGGSSGGGAGGGITADSLEAANIEGVSPDALKAAWKREFGRDIKSPSEVHALVGVSKSDLGEHGVVTVRASGFFGGMSVRVDASGLQIGRSYSKGEAKHDHLFISANRQGQGLGTRILKTSVRQYQRLGIKKVSLMAAEAGRYVWPSLGFRVSASSLRQYVSGFQKYAKDNGLKMPGKIYSVQQIARAPGGKQYLLSKHAPDLQDMSIRTARLAKELGRR